MSGWLYAVALHLEPVGGSRPPGGLGYQAYGLILRLIAAAEPDLARAIHGDQPRKPLTVSDLLPPRRAAAPAALRVTLLDGALFGALVRAVLEHPPDQPVRLGEHAFRLVGLATRPGESPGVAVTSFAELAAPPIRPPDRLRLAFVTPAVFRSGGARNALFPEPGLVFGGLLDKWNAFCPDSLRLELKKGRIDALLRVDAFALATRRVDFGAYAETGVQGWCGYRMTNEAGQAERAALGTLAAFAPFAGIGAKTTMGLGQVRQPGQRRGG